MMLIDLHCHLNMLDCAPGLAVEQAKSVGVKRLITIGTEAQDHPLVLQYVDEFVDCVYGTLGVHPHEAKQYSEQTDQSLRQTLLHPRIVAVGEIGLDYYYDHSPRELQLEVFRKQMQMAVEFKLPVQIHTRDAEADTTEVLSEFKNQVVGVIHCYTGSLELAKKCLDLGYNISFSGIVTFPKARELREVLAYVPVERMHVETDAPFLTPVPHRGRRNTPGMVIHTARFVAQQKNIEFESFVQTTWENAFKLFPKMT